jgi:dipeptidyl aminopeptidase/acylaminoacyl peptidase
MNSILELVFRLLACALITPVLPVWAATNLNPNLDPVIQRAIDYVTSVEQAPLIPRKTFAQKDELDTVLLSPNGKHIAYLQEKGRHQMLWLYDIAKQKHTRLLSAKTLSYLIWSPDSEGLYYQNHNSVIRVNIDPNQPAEIVYQLEDDNIEWLSSDENQSGILWFRRYLPSSKQYQLVRHENSVETLVFEGPLPVVGLLTESKGNPAIVKLLDGNVREIYEYVDEQLMLRFRCEVLDPCHLENWDEQHRVLHVSAYFNQDVLSLFRLDLDSNKRQLVFQDPEKRFDILHSHFDPQGIPSLVSVRDDHLSYEAMNESTQDALSRISIKMDSPLFRIEMNKAQDIWLIANGDPKQGGTQYAVYNQKSQQWQIPFEHISSKRFAPETLAPRVAFWYTASDGMPIHGYLTLPLGKSPDRVPLIVFPHGGPWTRADGRFSTPAQLMANRGYAVFEPNFRASIGYGKTFLTGPNREFGNGRVQQDILDGVEYLLQHGIGNPDELAIVGHSFGGFSALTALAFQPHLFKVAVATAPPANLSKTMQYFSRQIPESKAFSTLPRVRHLMVDIHDNSDIQRLYALSPDKAWNNMVKPLYLWAGENDDRVAIEDVRDLALRLQRAGKPVSLLNSPNQGHNPSHPLAREAFMYLIEKSLSNHLSGRMDTTMSQALRHYLKSNVSIDETGLLN